MFMGKNLCILFLHVSSFILARRQADTQVLSTFLHFEHVTWNLTSSPNSQEIEAFVRYKSTILVPELGGWKPINSRQRSQRASHGGESEAHLCSFYLPTVLFSSKAQVIKTVFILTKGALISLSSKLNGQILTSSLVWPKSPRFKKINHHE